MRQSAHHQSHLGVFAAARQVQQGIDTGRIDVDQVLQVHDQCLAGQLHSDVFDQFHRAEKQRAIQTEGLNTVTGACQFAILIAFDLLAA